MLDLPSLTPANSFAGEAMKKSLMRCNGVVELSAADFCAGHRQVVANFGLVDGVVVGASNSYVVHSEVLYRREEDGRVGRRKEDLVPDGRQGRLLLPLGSRAWLTEYHQAHIKPRKASGGS